MCCFAGTKHSHDVVCNVSGVAQTSLESLELLSLHTAPFRSLPLTDEMPLFFVYLLHFWTKLKEALGTQTFSQHVILLPVCTVRPDVQSVRQNHYFTLQGIFGVVLLLLHLGVCVHIMINWRAA